MPKRSRAFMLAQTTDYQTVDSLKKIAKKLPEGTQYAIVLHDKDAGTPHVHLAAYLQHATTPTALSKKLGIAPNFIEMWDKRVYNMWAYMLHHTKDAKMTKGDYTEYLDNPKKFVTNIDDYVSVARAPHASAGARLRQTITGILTGDITKRELLKPENLEFYYDNMRKIDNAIRLRTQSLQFNAPECTVAYIQGESGSGKTTKANTIAKTLYGDNYTTASSSNDPLQDYTGEKCLILDDFRPQDFKLVDLLGMLDPHYRQRTHASRYYNKPLATEMIIITSIYGLQQVVSYYNQVDPNEDMKQLRRRIQTLYNVKQDQPDEILTYNPMYDTYLPITGE